jgi:amino acid adenylation domain-containing protein/non-ribosomal peptide synthase protein (TIGR01720 family)
MRQFQLSGQQIRDLSHWQNTITATFDLPGNHSRDDIFSAIATVTDRHDICRTVFTYLEGVQIPFQTVMPEKGVENACFSTAELNLENPLSVSVSFRDVPTVTFRALTMILDIYTVQQLQEEILALLDGQVLEVAGDDLLQFGSYAAWESSLIEEGNAEGVAFWSAVSKQVSKETGLFQPGGVTASVAAEFDGAYIAGKAATLHVTEQALLITLFRQSLYRYTDGKPLTIGVLTDGRVYDELKMTLGPISRLYPLHFPGGSVDIDAEIAAAKNWNDYYYSVPANSLPFEFEFFNNDLDIQDDFAGCLKLRVQQRQDRWKLELISPAVDLLPFVLADLTARLRDITLPEGYLNAMDKAAIAAYNNTAGEIPAHTVPDMIREVFRTKGDLVAVQGVNEEISYAQLQEQAENITSALIQDYGVVKGDIIGIMITDDMQVPAALLGVLFAGAAYLPLDPGNPEERLNYIIRDSTCKLIITDELVKKLMQQHEKYDPVQIAPDDTAYLIYTSGTTGHPKGCQLLHSNLVNYIYWANNYYFGNDNEGNFPLLTNLSFDLTITSIFTTLSRGRTIYCLDPSWSLTDKLRYCFQSSNGIDAIKLTPTHISLLADAGVGHSNVRCAIVGGEELLLSQVGILRTIAPDIKIYNEYGPTEATVGCVVKLVDEHVTIGNPITNMRMQVLDGDENPVPPGVAGELYISGAGVAKGYWKRPDLTAEKFRDLPSGRCYRTGDLVRLLPGQDMEFLGRIDEQVKIRGNRIELGEIQEQLSVFGQFVIAVKKDAGAEKYITAYYLDTQEIAIGEVKAFLQHRLPDYMVPAFFIPIHEIPLTANGKLDVKALPDPFVYQSQIQRAYVPPATQTEQQLAAIWAGMLQVERVGITDNFFELGGHSLLAMRVVSAIRREMNADLVMKDLFGNPTIQALATLIGSMQATLLLPALIPVEKKPLQIPLSWSQERLWFIDQLRGSTHYHMPSVFRLQGDLDVAALEGAFRDVVNRHESLRTVFKQLDGIPYQEVLGKDGWRLDVHHGPVADPEQLVEEEIRRPFDLSRDHPLRAKLIRLTDNEYLLVLVRHHIAADGWSGSLLVQEFEAFYHSRTTGGKPDVPVLSLQYADYAIWQRNYLVDEVLEKQLAYWEEQLRDVTPLNMPLDYPRPALQSVNGANLNFVISKQLSGELNALAQQQGVTLFMLLLSVYKVLLHKYTGQDDICVGTTMAHRPAAELEPLIGFFVNTLALRSDLGNNPVFSDLLHHVKQTTLEGYGLIGVPFEKVVDRVEKERDKSRSSIFQTLLVLDNNSDASAHSTGSLVVEPQQIGYQTAKFDLTFFAQESDAGIAISINYCTDLFAKATIERLKAHFQTLLAVVAKHPDLHIGDLKMLSPEEEQLLISYNRPAAAYPSGTIISLFEAQVASNPGAVAIRFGEVVMSYGELNERATKLGAHLKQQYVTAPGSLVGIMMDTSHWSVIAILAVLKAGAAYVPIDLELPKERQLFMIKDTGISALIITSESLFEVGDFDVPVYAVDIQSGDLEAVPASAPLASPDDLCYVIYTSGTTGQPKGVMISHANIVDYYFGLKPFIAEHSSFGLMSALSADLGNTVLFGSLLGGGTLHLFTKQQLMSPGSLHRYFAAQQIDCIKIVPSHWSALETLLPAKTIIFGGEALPVSVIQKIRSVNPALVVINHYGPTETTIGKLLHVVNTNRKYYTVPVGQPFSHTQVYVVDGSLALCPVGVPGELLIGGDGVSPGYLHQPELTAEKFIRTPYGSRVYRTGDLVRRLENGDIEFMGRVDDQVKIRGYRVEPGEVGRVLSGYKDVQQCVVIYREQQLVAYVVGAYDKADLISYLQSLLPDYMVPSIFVNIAEMPLTTNGKVNKRALPAPEAVKAADHVAPRTPLETKLAAIWSAVLNIESVSIADNFFELGGHSLLAIRVLSAIRKELNIEVSITDLFDHLTIEALAAFIASHDHQTLLPPIVPQQRPERIPLSYAQERLWFIDQLRGSTHYHMPSVFRLQGALDVTALEQSFRDIIDRHESLRTVFKEADGVGYQEILPPGAWTLEITDTTDLDELIGVEVARPFDLTRDYMMRVRLVKIKEDEHVLILVRHHIASDGWSVSLIIREFISLYRFYTTNQLPVLPELPLQYADYAIWQRTYLTGDVLEQQLAYWEQQLKDITPLQLPVDYPRPAVQSTKGARLNFTFDKELSQQLQALAEQEGVTLFVLLLTIYKVLLHKYSSQTDIAVGTTVAHRAQQELEPMIGFFVNTLVLRTDMGNDPVFRTLLSQVKRTTLEGYEHLSVPFEKVVDRVEKERDKSRSSLFQALFVLNNNEEVEIQDLGDLLIQPESAAYEIAKFDLTFFAKETTSGIAVSINYNSDLFARETIRRMRGHFLQLASSAVNNADQRIGALRMLHAKEEEQLLGFNHSFVTYPATTIIGLFEAQVSLQPDTTAVKYGATELSYRELDEKATRLGAYLRDTYHLQPNDLVGIMMDTTEWSVVSILGVLRAGAAYVPIDPALPKERQHFIVSDTGIRVLLISSESLFDVIDLDVPVFSVDIQFDELAVYTYLKPVSPELAYVIYTSGTTGQPKGVMITDTNVVDYYMGLKGFISDNSSFGLMSSLSADLGNTVLFGALLGGGTLHLFTKQQLMNPAWLHSYFAADPIDCIKIVPSHWRALETLLPAQTIIFGGEALPVSVVENIKAANPLLTVINHYGPTETTIGKLMHVVNFKRRYQSVPVGQPFSNTVVYVVDNTFSLCPVGVPGELLIGGDGVSPGYLHQPVLTAEKFIETPFCKRVYRTGDLVRRLENGDIEFVGRVDDQVKIRGYRVEPGEIAKVLSNMEGIRQSAVVYKEHQLRAYLVGEFDTAIVVGYLKSRLPDYMIPSVFIALPEMPLTANGKVNKKALPEPDVVVTTNYIAPRNQVEADLAEIWASLLHAEKVGTTDNFFELGGDSIIVIQVVSRAKRKGYQVQVQDLFDHQTVADLAALILSNNEKGIVAEQGLLTGEVPLLPIQHWFFEKGNVNHFNQAVLLQLDKKVTADTLLQIVKTIVARHDILRGTYTHGNDGWIQTYGEREGTLDVVHATAADITGICRQYQESMNITDGIVNKFVLINTPADESYNRLFMVIHHLAVDGISWRILIDEISSLLAGTADLGAKTSSYREWAVALNDLAFTESVLSQQSYWEKIAAAYEPLPVELPAQESTYKELSTVDVHLSSELTQSLLKEVNTAYNTEINDLLLCALALTVKDWSGHQHVVVGLEGHGREALFPHLDITGTVGWFTNKYPVLLQLDNHIQEGNALKSVKEQLRSIPDKGMGFGCLRYLNPVSNLGGKCWDIVFNYLGQQDNVVNANEWFKGAPEYPGEHISREYPVRDNFVIRAVVTGNALHITFSYSARQYTAALVQSLADKYIQHLTSLIDHCVMKEDRDVTPADFGLSGKLDYRELDALLGKGALEDEDGVMKF